MSSSLTKGERQGLEDIFNTLKHEKNYKHKLSNYKEKWNSTLYKTLSSAYYITKKFSAFQKKVFKKVNKS